MTLATEIANSITSDSPNSDVALFVPYVYVEAAMNAVNGKLQVGAEVSASVVSEDVCIILCLLGSFVLCLGSEDICLWWVDMCRSLVQSHRHQRLF